MSSLLESNVVTGAEAFECGIQKSLLFAGSKKVDFVVGTKVYFHYKTLKHGDASVVIDDTKQFSKPMELIIGKKFKLEVWERCLQTMWLHEVSKFSVIKEFVLNYAVVSKQLRDYFKKQDCKSHSCGGGDHGHDHGSSHHMCGFNALTHGVGYDDLNELLRNPQPLDFIFEIVKVEQPDEYTKESWVLTDDEKLKLIPTLKEEGNKLYAEKEYEKAVEKYHAAISYLEQLMGKEKPKDVEWNELNEKKLPILLNYIQCKLCLREYYSVLEHAATVLEFEPTNIKALFRRGKAHRALFNVNEAKADFNKVMELDAKMKPTCVCELNELEKEIKAKNESDKQLFKGKLFA